MKLIVWIGLLLTAVVTGCGTADSGSIGKVNLFSIEDDKALGKQLDEEILSQPDSFPVLSRVQYAAAYSHLDRIAQTILQSGQVRHKDAFSWTFRIIHDDDVLNAFATPGGYIYVYTGLIKYLSTEDALAGVLAHEIAHADQRHSTQQLTRAFGLSVLIDIALGKNQGTLSDIAAGLASLKFSRDHESEADKYSVNYLCPTAYNAAGAAIFFEQLEAGGSPRMPEFLSTHPSPVNRIAAIKAYEEAAGCAGTQDYASRYKAFIATLPR